MTEPADYDSETTPAVMLAGKPWPIPELVWRDLRKCRAELIELNTRVNEALERSDGPADEEPISRNFRQLGVLAAALNALDNDDFDRLVMGPIFVALRSLHPSLSRDEFDSWRTTETERQTAWLTVRRQSGLFVFSAGADEEPGEEAGAA